MSSQDVDDDSSDSLSSLSVNKIVLEKDSEIVSCWFLHCFDFGRNVITTTTTIENKTVNGK